MPVGDKPILELVIRRLHLSGFRWITIAVGHLAPLIQAYFGNGERFGVRLDYSCEDEPLGTAGPLSSIAGLDAPFLVMNGDLLTDVDFAAMIAFHRENRALATVGIYDRDLKIDLGVIEVDGSSHVTGYIEKPVYHFKVSMGIYVLEPAVLRYVVAGKKFDLPDLVHCILSDHGRAFAYHHRGYWLDIGRLDDYERAQQDAAQLVPRLLDPKA
jgi:NDP-sugar pyrophosphorylase family protein